MLLNSCLRFPSTHPAKHRSYTCSVELCSEEGTNGWPGLRVCCVPMFTHTHARIHTHAALKMKKKANPQTTARGDCANLLLTCENELPRLITWQRLDHSCQLKTRVVCQQETKSDTCWKGFVCSSFLIFFLFFPAPPLSSEIFLTCYHLLFALQLYRGSLVLEHTTLG